MTATVAPLPPASWTNRPQTSALLKRSPPPAKSSDPFPWGEAASAGGSVAANASTTSPRVRPPARHMVPILRSGHRRGAPHRLGRGRGGRGGGGPDGGRGREGRQGAAKLGQ